MKRLLLISVMLIVNGCATSPGQGFLDPFMDKVAAGSSQDNTFAGSQAAQAATNAGNAAAEAGNTAAAASNAASMHQMMTPPPSGF